MAHQARDFGVLRRWPALSRLKRIAQLCRRRRCFPDADKRRRPEMATSRGSSIAQWQRLKKPRATIRPIPIQGCKCSDIDHNPKNCYSIVTTQMAIGLRCQRSRVGSKRKYVLDG